MKKYALKNLDCPNCAAKLEDSIKGLSCVDYVSVNFATLSMHIETSDIEKVKSKINDIEPDIKVDEIAKKENKNYNLKKEFIIMGISLIIFVAGLLVENFIKTFPYNFLKYVIFLFVYFLTGWKVLYKAFTNITKGKIFDENFLMGIATIGALCINAFSEAAGVMLFYKIGEFFQELSLNNSRKSISSLLEVRPDYANLKNNGDMIKVSPYEVKVDDLIIVKPGEKIPLDGVILSGESFLDTSSLTGEHKPKNVGVGDRVFAGMINNNGVLTIKVTKIFTQSSISKILELVEDAIEHKSKTENFISIFARYYTPIVVILALFIAFIPPFFLKDATFSQWIYKALVLLVISCPCALVISIPLGYFGGIGFASKNGILIKGSNYLEALSNLKTIAFDKTGTLTKGVFKVSTIISQNNFKKDEIIEYAAKAESHSNHPIAISIVEYYGKNLSSILIEEYQEVRGMGIKAKIDGKNIIVGNDKLFQNENVNFLDVAEYGTIVHIAVDKIYAGYIIINDQIKEDSFIAVKTLKEKGVNDIIMLTGDNFSSAKDVSDKLGISTFYSSLLPEEKLAIFDKLEKRTKNHNMAFVGDGVNDAPVLAKADIGISMGCIGSDAAIEIADVVIMDDSLTKIATAINIAKKTKTIIWQNIIMALGIKLVFVLLALFGIAIMWEAVFADMGVSLLALFNSMRIFRMKG